MTTEEELMRSRKELRKLRQHEARLERSVQQLRDKSDKLKKTAGKFKEENKNLKDENKNLKGKIEVLKDKLSSLLGLKEKLAGMIFKSNKKKDKKSKKKRGGQKGHKGNSKPTPTKINEHKHCFLSHCPDCGEKVKRAKKVYQKIVEDIPEPQPVVVTKYTIEKQYCKKCKKPVTALPPNTLKNTPFGTGIATKILILKYNYRVPLAKIQEYFLAWHSLSISQGAVQNILNKAQKHFGNEYNDILTKIRNSNFKHADETGWRIEGKNNWCWLFATNNEALYTIEETRGKGVPEKILTKNPLGVLVRDDYGAYKNLKMPQQSCWTHLLRVSRDAKSEESKKLHKELKRIFKQLNEIVDFEFDENTRKKEYLKYEKRMQKIIRRKYKQKDTAQVQTRIKNQGLNLITALLYADVSLTNNHAEQQIRPLAVQRKISGGSRSNLGAQIQAVNMSIIQTLKLRNKDLSTNIKALLELPIQKNATTINC